MKKLYQKILLASKSPRRQQLMQQMGFEFELALKDVDESFPDDIPLADVAAYIAKKKSDAFIVSKGEILLTADTTVLINEEILNKPLNDVEAFAMLNKLNGKHHEVVTGVALRTVDSLFIFSETTEVEFSKLSDDQLWYYIRKYQPFDKAGAYGIQDWIGAVGVKRINGSYTNVMGLPTERLYKELMKLAE